MSSPQKIIRQAIKAAATEHAFFVELKKDLAALKKDLANAKQKKAVKDIKRCFRDFAYIGIAERRLNNKENHAEEIIRHIHEQRITVSGPVREIKGLLEHLDIEARSLIHDSSRWEGEIKGLLAHLQKEVQEHQPEQAQAVLMELTQRIDGAEKWLAALSSDLEKAKRMVEENGKVKVGEKQTGKEQMLLEKCKELYAMNYNTADIAEKIYGAFIVGVVQRYYGQLDPHEEWQLISTDERHLTPGLRKEADLLKEQLLKGYRQIGATAQEIKSMAGSFPAHTETIEKAASFISGRASSLLERYEGGNYIKQDMVSGTAAVLEQGNGGPVLIAKETKKIAACFGVDLKEWWVQEKR